MVAPDGKIMYISETASVHLGLSQVVRASCVLVGSSCHTNPKTVLFFFFFLFLPIQKQTNQKNSG